MGEILLIDDDDLLRRFIVALLEKRKYGVQSTARGEAGIELAAQSVFDLVITDVSLPAMSGIELARSILALKPRVPIILASGYDLDFAVENWGGNVRSIIKPFDAAEIEALMSKLMTGAEAS